MIAEHMSGTDAGGLARMRFGGKRNQWRMVIWVDSV
jgi:hypothetical protein